VAVRVRELPIPGDFCTADYGQDPEFRMRFQKWLGSLWQEKDGQIEALARST
jgi:hypothetical protein